jgi:hypothetical protein
VVLADPDLELGLLNQRPPSLAFNAFNSGNNTGSNTETTGTDNMSRLQLIGDALDVFSRHLRGHT